MHFGFSLTVMLIGLLIVFLGLIILICCIKVMSKIVGAMRAKADEKAARKAAASAPAQPAVTVPEPVAQAAAAEAEVSQDELVAVITAALMAYQKNNSNKTLVVRNIRRANAWSGAGRSEQLARF